MTAEEIREARKAAGLTQEELAREVGVSVTTVNRWEMGAHKPARLPMRVLREFFIKARNGPQIIDAA